MHVEERALPERDRAAEVVLRLARAVRRERAGHCDLRRRVAADAVERPVVQVVDNGEQRKLVQLRARVEVDVHHAVRSAHGELALERTPLRVACDERTDGGHVVEVRTASVRVDRNLAVRPAHRHAVVAPEYRMEVQVQPEVAVDEVYVPLAPGADRLRHARERVHVRQHRRKVERYDHRTDVRLPSLAVHLPCHALRVEVDGALSVERHRAVDVGPFEMYVADLEPAALHLDRGAHPLRRDAKHLGADQDEVEGRQLRELHVDALVALHVAGLVVAVVQPRDLQSLDADPPREEVDRHPLRRDERLQRIGPLLVVEPHPADARAVAEPDSGRVALEDEALGKARAHRRHDPRRRNALLAEEQAAYEKQKNDEGPLHRLHQKFQDFLHCRNLISRVSTGSP